MPSSLLQLINHDSSYLRVITKIKHFVVPLKRTGITIMNTLVRMYSTTRGRLVNVKIVGRRCVSCVLERDEYVHFLRPCMLMSVSLIHYITVPPTWSCQRTMDEGKLLLGLCMPWCTSMSTIHINPSYSRLLFTNKLLGRR